MFVQVCLFSVFVQVSLCVCSGLFVPVSVCLFRCLFRCICSGAFVCVQVCYGSSCNGIFSASRDKTIKMWQRGNSHCMRDFTGHELVVTAIHLNTGEAHVFIYNVQLG